MVGVGTYPDYRGGKGSESLKKGNRLGEERTALQTGFCKGVNVQRNHGGSEKVIILTGGGSLPGRKRNNGGHVTFKGGKNWNG